MLLTLFTVFALFVSKQSSQATGQFSHVLHHPYQAAIDQALRWRDQQPAQAIALLEKTIQQARTERREDKVMIAALYDHLAMVHESRWHLLAALNARRIAEHLAPEPLRQTHIAALQRSQTEMESEHRQEREYHAGRQSGPAHTLTGTVLIADIYIDTGIGSHWGNKERLLARRASKKIETWLAEQAGHWQTPAASLISREFSVSLKLPERSNSIAFLSDGSLNSILLQLGYRDLNSFIEALAKPSDADQVAIVLHVPVTRRSYARRCQGKHPTPLDSAAHARVCLEEYAVVASRVEHNNWGQFSHTKAHELLHLFGADDLYNKAGGETYLATDIMHYPSRQLPDANIGQITAWAVGWNAEQPEAPFHIID